MSEITLKINKTTSFIVAALLIGGIGGYFLNPIINKTLSPANTNQVAQKPENNNLPAPSPSPKISISNADHIKGDKNAPITLVEYSDFQCPFCKRFHPTLQRVVQEYSGKVRWVYRHFPLSFHQNAQKAAEASECAGKQGKFWDYTDKLFENSQADGTGLNTEDLKRYAKELGLNTDKFNSCLESRESASKVRADFSFGEAAGVTGTPGTILIDKNGNTQLISGAVPYEQLKAAIDIAL